MSVELGSTQSVWVAFSENMSPCGDSVTSQCFFCGQDMDNLCGVAKRIASIKGWPNEKLDCVTESTEDWYHSLGR